MSGSEKPDVNLQEEVQSLREEVEKHHRMLVLVASTVAMIEGQQNVSHTYLRRALAELEGSSMGRLIEESVKSEKLTFDLERGLKIMADRAEDMNLPQLEEYLTE